MSAQQVSIHEKTSEHLRALAALDHDTALVLPAPDGGRTLPGPSGLNTKNLSSLPELEKEDWVALGAEVVDFWRAGVHAAECGEQPEQLQGFLERLVGERLRQKESNNWTSDTAPASVHRSNGMDWDAWEPGREEEVDVDSFAEFWKRPDAPDVSAWEASAHRDQHDPWSPGAPQPNWDNWGKPDAWHKTNTSRAHISRGGQVWRHPQSSRDSSCRSNQQASGSVSGSQRLEDFAEKFSARNHLNPTRKGLLQRFAKLQPEEQIAQIHEATHQLRLSTRV
ncbi:hypothetical protein K488DRAFT_81864 [Vararia minispora EC-137]|uniref:Uncharacterized protein n=1 Tax=Vararia minispora EC-137 TaxID=1314806 RepID=A0ACB8QXP4_9AGAM|nr:hypothetical protein K488DRAFT_81864 [Vararia minispora EC-137]